MPVEEGAPPPDVELPEDLGAWTQAILEADISKIMEQDNLDVLVSAWLDHKGKWLAASKVLKKFGVLTMVKGEVEKAGRKEVTARLQAKRRHNVNTGGAKPWGSLSFKVVKLVITTSDPPRYEFEIQLSGDNKIHFLTMETSHLTSAAKFRNRFREIIHRTPKGLHIAAEEWDELQDFWLDNAEHREPSAESSEAGAIKALIRDTIRSLPVGDHLSDLKHGHVLRHEKAEDMWLAYGAGLKLTVKNLYGGKIAADLWGFVLTKLNIGEERVRVDGRQMRVLVFHRRLDEPEDPDPQFHRKPKPAVQEDLLN